MIEMDKTYSYFRNLKKYILKKIKSEKKMSKRPSKYSKLLKEDINGQRKRVSEHLKLHRSFEEKDNND